MKYTITLKNLHKDEPKDWARENCKSYISCTIHGSFENEVTTVVHYHFENEYDAFWFRMRWE